MKLIKWFLIVALIVGGVAAGLWYSDDKKKQAAEEDAPSLVATAERRDLESNLLLTGEITPAYAQDVKSEVGGKIKSINVEIGQTVHKGDLLAVIDDTDLLTQQNTAQTNIDGATLEMEKTQGNYERAKALYEQKLISKESFANLESDLAIAKNALEKAQSTKQSVQDQLKKTRILAPFDGTVLDIPVNLGQVVVAAASVNSGTLIMPFADLSQLLIKCQVNQVDAPRLKQDLPVGVNMGEQEVPLKAHIQFIAPLAKVVNNIKGFEVRALIDQNDGRLKPGMSVSMNVPVGKAEDVLSVPVSAIFRDNKQSVVYVRKGEGSEKRKVTIGLTNLSFAEIKSGVKEGEEILLVEPASTPGKS